MSTVLLDTSVASLLHPRRKGSSLRALYAPHLAGRTLVVCFQTVAELRLWADERGWGSRLRDQLDAVLARLVVLPYTDDLGRAWARLTMHSRRIGRALDASDAWIAATAVLYRLPLVTHDADFVGLDVDGLDVICHAAPRA